MATSTTTTSSLAFYDDVRKETATFDADSQQAGLIKSVRYSSNPNIVGVKFHRNERVLDEDNIMDKAKRHEVQEVELRHLVFIAPLTHLGVPIPVMVSRAAAALLSMHHFNNGITSTTNSVSQDCPIKFTLEVRDSELSPQASAKEVANDVLLRMRQPLNITNPSPTAVLGPLISATTKATATLTSMSQLPQMAYSATSDIFNNKDEYPLLTRSTRSNGDLAVMATEYLRSVVGTTHVALAYFDSIYGFDFERAFRSVASEMQPEMNVISAKRPAQFLTQDYLESLEETMKTIVESEYRHVVAMARTPEVSNILGMAKEYGLVGPDMFWLFVTGQATMETTVVEASDMPLFHGVAILSFAPPSRLKDRWPEYDEFLSEWSKAFQTNEALAYLQSKLPPKLWIQPEAPFHNISAIRILAEPDNESLRVYDSVTAIALASCQAASTKNTTGLHEFTAQNFHDALVYNTSFNGAYGRVAFDPKTGSRSVGTVPHVVTNILVERNSTNDPYLTEYVSASTDHRVGEDGTLSVWVVEDSFVYSDGSTVPPNSLPPINLRHVPLVARFFGLFLSGLVIVLSIGFASWTLVRRKRKVVRASQPSFLRMLCVGTLLAGLSGVLDSMQDPVGMEVLNVSCMLSIWLFSVGHTITFVALFTKLRRVNKVFYGSGRVRWTIRDNMDIFLPCVMLAFLELVVLSVWTTESPVTYQLEFINTAVDEYGRPSDARGICRDGKHQYWLVVALLYCIATIVTVREAYWARRVEVHYSDSHHIFIAGALILQQWIMSIPIKMMAPPYWDYVKLINVPMGAFVILFAIFAPKIVKAERHQRPSEPYIAPLLDPVSEDSGSHTSEEKSDGDHVDGVAEIVATSPVRMDRASPVRISCVTKSDLLGRLAQVSPDAARFALSLAIQNGGIGNGNNRAVELQTITITNHTNATVPRRRHRGVTHDQQRGPEGDAHSMGSCVVGEPSLSKQRGGGNQMGRSDDGSELSSKQKNNVRYEMSS